MLNLFKLKIKNKNTEAFPAVTRPSFLNTALSFAKLSRVVSRGCSSTSNTSPLFDFKVIGSISDLKYPALFAKKNKQKILVIE